jgi:integrase
VIPVCPVNTRGTDLFGRRLTICSRVYSEILPLESSQVDLAEGTVRLAAGTTKNGDGRVVALPAELRALLDRLWAEHLSLWPECPFVFHRAGQRTKAFRDAWATACTTAGLAGSDP